jgi:O-antigen/teichoic acid export membrane protein
LETRRVLVASLPYFAQSIAISLVNRLDVSMLEFMAPGPEVGWYCAASNIASLAMLLSPLLGWIFMPLLARAKHRSKEELFSILRRAFEGFLVFTIPISLIIMLSADFVVGLAFGASFAPAARSLQILALVFVATYSCILLSTGIVLLDRPWLVTWVCLAGIAVQPVITLSVGLITRRLGPGGYGAAAASGVVGMEFFQLCVFLWFLGRSAIDRRSLLAVVKSLAVALLILPIDYMLRPLVITRLVVDMASYVALALLLRVERLSEIRFAIQLVRSKGKIGVAE